MAEAVSIALNTSSTIKLLRDMGDAGEHGYLPTSMWTVVGGAINVCGCSRWEVRVEI